MPDNENDIWRIEVWNSWILSDIFTGIAVIVAHAPYSQHGHNTVTQMILFILFISDISCAYARRSLEDTLYDEGRGICHLGILNT